MIGRVVQQLRHKAGGKSHRRLGSADISLYLDIKATSASSGSDKSSHNSCHIWLMIRQRSARSPWEDARDGLTRRSRLDAPPASMFPAPGSRGSHRSTPANFSSPGFENCVVMKRNLPATAVSQLGASVMATRYPPSRPREPRQACIFTAQLPTPSSSSPQRTSTRSEATDSSWTSRLLRSPLPSMPTSGGSKFPGYANPTPLYGTPS